ncbi:MAG: hypothetical protein JWM59_602 [Verrucomicrobiales bacterium]|nr:hypothetical protein [Verrucomicrobiales bacterium]
MTSNVKPLPAVSEAPGWIDLVKRKVDALRFGSVQIVIHEGRVTTVEATEKTRLPVLGAVAGATDSH